VPPQESAEAPLPRVVDDAGPARLDELSGAVVGHLEHALVEKFPHVQFGPPPQGQVTEVMEWSVQAFGAEDLDPKFALVENVVERFATHLTYDHPNAAVEPINDPSSRIFGWRLHTW
jgi:hypothetical protein